MCGIAGIIDRSSAQTSATKVRSMCDSLAHRGPDGEGFWTSNDGTVHLGHRRLSIIDLSEKGAQPMTFNQRYTITFNGEIYNYQALKKELIAAGYQFFSTSDTEVVLAAYDYWKEKCLKHFDGMFAFALYDIETEELFCARDRFGEKPFFYTMQDDVFYFASEIKAFWSIGLKKTINKSLMYLYLTEDLVENPTNTKESFYEGIYQLDPASYFYFGKNSQQPEVKKYWEISITEDQKKLTFEESVTQFQELFNKAVASRTIADVTVGCSLSGGLDSSSIVATIAQSDKSIPAFSARFDDYEKDEGAYIELVSNHFQTKQYDKWITSVNFEEQFERLLYYQDEPFQSGSIFAQYCVYETAKNEGVKVVIDGQGADELLGGYDKDFAVYARELQINNKDFQQFAAHIKANHATTIQVRKIDLFALKYPKTFQFAVALKNRIWNKVPTGIADPFHAKYAPNKPVFYRHKALKASLKYEMTVQGLPKLLRFADRNAMAHSVESRLPFLSPELVAFVFQLNSDYFLHEGWSKALLRSAMKNNLPEKIIQRKDKIGFEAPHHQWLKTASMQRRIEQSRKLLIEKGYITDKYTDSWKIVIAAYYI